MYVDIKYPETTSIHDLDSFYEAIRNTLQYWLDIHTDAEWWASSYCIDADPVYALSVYPIVSNRYFYFDWKEATRKTYAKNCAHQWSRCSECGSLLEYGDWCGCDDAEQLDVAPEELEEFLEDIGDIEYYEEDIWEALVTEGFQVYQDALGGYIAGPVENVIEGIRLMDEARTGMEKNLAMHKATEIYHVHGYILSDYGDYIGFDWGLVDIYRNEGLSALAEAINVSEEELDEWLMEEPVTWSKEHIMLSPATI